VIQGYCTHMLGQDTARYCRILHTNSVDTSGYCTRILHGYCSSGIWDSMDTALCAIDTIRILHNHYVDNYVTFKLKIPNRRCDVINLLQIIICSLNEMANNY